MSKNSFAIWVTTLLSIILFCGNSRADLSIGEASSQHWYICANLKDARAVVDTQKRTSYGDALAIFHNNKNCGVEDGTYMPLKLEYYVEFPEAKAIVKVLRVRGYFNDRLVGPVKFAISAEMVNGSGISASLHPFFHLAQAAVTEPQDDGAGLLTLKPGDVVHADAIACRQKDDALLIIDTHKKKGVEAAKAVVSLLRDAGLCAELNAYFHFNRVEKGYRNLPWNETALIDAYVVSASLQKGDKLFIDGVHGQMRMSVVYYLVMPFAANGTSA